MGKTALGRLEDYITLAMEGKQVQVSIDLKKQIVIPKVHEGDTEGLKSKTDLILFWAEYTFQMGENVKKVSKVYMFETSEESLDNAMQNILIANQRLKMDYQRLGKAKIMFEEKYFD